MKILFTLTPAFNPNDGGVQRTTFKLGKYFTEQGLSVAYYSLEKEGHIEPEYGVLFKAPELGNNDNINNIKNLGVVLEQFQPDIVINQMPYVQELRQVLAANKQKINYVLLGCLRNSLFNFKSNTRDVMQQMLPSWGFKLLDNKFGIGFVQKRHWLKHRRELKTIIDQHDKFILLAPPNRDELAHFIGTYKPEKVDAIPNSIPEVYRGELKKENIILHVGRINIPQKRSDLLLDFWEHTCEKLPDWTFVIVGDGPYLETLEKDLLNRNLPRVQLEGYKKPESYFKKAAIFMMPSAYEGFPNTILEAQSFGCATLAFASYAALNWIVNDGKDAYLSAPYNTQQMATHAVNLGLDSDKLVLSQRFALSNAKRFTIDKVGKIWLNYFKEIGVNK